MHKTPVIGILGGIGSGKSTVAQAFGRMGCAVINADALAHDVLREPAVQEAVTGRFGPDVLNTAGGIDRAALGRRAFDNQRDVEFLNGLVHPPVLAQCERLLSRYQEKPEIKAIVLDMPLLTEVGWEKNCDFLVFVECQRLKRLERMLKNGKIDEEQLKKREKFQISLDKKRQIAHYSVNNNSDDSDIVEQVAQIFSNLATAKSE